MFLGLVFLKTFVFCGVKSRKGVSVDVFGRKINLEVEVEMSLILGGVCVCDRENTEAE